MLQLTVLAFVIDLQYHHTSNNIQLSCFRIHLLKLFLRSVPIILNLLISIGSVAFNAAKIQTWDSWVSLVIGYIVAGMLHISYLVIY